MIITGTVHEALSIFMAITCRILVSVRNISAKSCRENLNTHFIFNNSPRPPPQISYRLWGHMEKCTERQTTNDNMADAHCMMYNSAYKYVFRACNNHCCPTATMVTRTRLSIMLPVLFLLKTRDFWLEIFSQKFVIYVWGKPYIFRARQVMETNQNREYKVSTYLCCRSQWPRGLGCRSAPARLPKLWVRIPPE